LPGNTVLESGPIRSVGFRSYFREKAPDFKVLEPIVCLDEPENAYRQTLEMLKTSEELVASAPEGSRLGIVGPDSALQAMANAPLSQPHASLRSIVLAGNARGLKGIRRGGQLPKKTPPRLRGEELTQRCLAIPRSTNWRPLFDVLITDYRLPITD